MNRNNADFQYNSNAAVGKTIANYRNDGYLGPQQYLIREYMTGKITGYVPRGILMYHDMGTGKTRAFVATAAALRKPVIAVMAATLVDNFKLTIASYENRYRVSIAKMFTFFSLDAYNMYEKLEAFLGEGASMNGYTVVIDEAHELFSKVLNADTKNGPKLYHAIIRSPSATLLLGSGTPLWKDPAEVVPCFNMLSESTAVTGKPLFPENYGEFYDMFIDRGFRELVEEDNNESAPVAELFKSEEERNKSRYNLSMGVRNGHLLQNRIFGLVSFIPRNPVLFPTKRPTIVERIPLDPGNQWVAYRQARLDEIDEIVRAAKFKRAVQSGPGIGQKRAKSSTTYRQRSRALCNANRQADGSIVSPKLKKLIANLETAEGKGIVYSQFKENGIYLLADMLIAAGWTELFPQVRRVHAARSSEVAVETPDDGAEETVAELDEEVDISESPPPVEEKSRDLFTKTFVIMDGDTPKELREKIMATYNAPTNRYGTTLRVILGTSIVTRGISLKCGMHAHVMEPYWYYAQTLQFETRISRMGSHDMMPADMRYTQTYIYLSLLPERLLSLQLGEDDPFTEIETTDEVLYYRSLARQFVLDEFLNLFKEVAIECPMLAKIVPNADHSKVTCRVCNPTHKRLFTDNIFDDLNTPDPCNALVTKSVVTKKITLGDSEYRYTQEGTDASTSVFGMAIYIMDPKLRAYTRLAESDPLFLQVYDAALKK